MNLLLLGVVGTTCSIILDWIAKTKKEANTMLWGEVCIVQYHSLILIGAKLLMLSQVV